MANLIEALRDIPVRIVRTKLGQVAYVTNVVTDAVPFGIGSFQFPASHVLDQLDAFDQRRAIFATAAKIINFARSRRIDEFLKRTYNVIAVYLIADLLALIAKYRVMTTRNDLFDQV